MRQYNAKDGYQRSRAQNKKWKKENHETYKNSQLKCDYGITLEDYRVLEENQGFICAVCKEPKKENKKYFHVDHNHTTGKVRGLLCSGCNTALGSLKENTTIMRNLIEYVEHYEMER